MFRKHLRHFWNITFPFARSDTHLKQKQSFNIKHAIQSRYIWDRLFDKSCRCFMLWEYCSVNKQKTEFYASNGQLHSLDNITVKNKLILINKSYPEHLAPLLFLCDVIYDSSSVIYITNSS